MISCINRFRALSIYQEISEIPVGMLMANTFSRTFHGKNSGKKWNFEMVVLISPLETFRWKCMFLLRAFTRNHQFQAIYGGICATILNAGD